MKQNKKPKQNQTLKNSEDQKKHDDNGQEKIEDKICLKCNRRILNFDKYVLLGTYKNKIVMEEVYFHFSCYEAYFKESVQKTVNAMMEKTMKSVSGLMSVINPH